MNNVVLVVTTGINILNNNSNTNNKNNNYYYYNEHTWFTFKKSLILNERFNENDLRGKT